MLIQGQIIAIMPPDYSDQYGNQYQNITVQTVQGNVEGRKASKTAYGPNDIGRQVAWECTQAQSQRGDYNKFTMPPDPKYSQQRQNAPQGSPQTPQNVPQTTKPQSNGRNTSIERQCAFKAACGRARGSEMTPSDIVELARQGQYFIETGNNINEQPRYEDQSTTPEDDIPF